MHAKFGVSYHRIPELYRRMKLPVFDRVQEALEKHNVRRKRWLEREKVKKRRIELKRVIEGFQRSEWSKKHGCDAACHIRICARVIDHHMLLLHFN